LSAYLASLDEVNRPLSIIEGLKFAKQAFFLGDSNNYSMPSQYDMPGMMEYLRFRRDTGTRQNSFARRVGSFMDSTRQDARLSVNMADVGSERLPVILDSINKKSEELFSEEKYEVTLTGTSITFLEGSRFIINGLKESIFSAFLLIAACILYLFRSFRILIISLIPHVIPLAITAGVMGWVRIPLQPSTVLAFSVALGPPIDITIR